MKVLTLKRTHPLHPQGVFSVLDDEGEPFCVCVENKKFLIPLGEYILKPCVYYGGDGVGGHPDYRTYQIMDVVGKSEVKIHKGNWDFDSHACLIIAEQFAILKGRAAVGNSAEAFTEFMNRMAGAQEAKLVIKEWKD